MSNPTPEFCYRNRCHRNDSREHGNNQSYAAAPSRWWKTTKNPSQTNRPKLSELHL